METKINLKLKDIPKTMLIPLRARYLETKQKYGIIHDPKTIEILDKINFDWSGKNEVSSKTQMGVSIRTEILDELTVKFLSKNKDAIVVNLGCGLDTRYYRLNNNYVMWYDLDVPEAIELRNNFFKEEEKFKFIPKSILDFSWMSIIPKGKPTLFIAEWLFMYFTEKEIKSLLKEIKKVFSGSEMILEAMSPFLAKNTDKHPDMKNQTATFKWGIKSGKEIENWWLEIKFIEEYYYFDRHIDKYPFIVKVLRTFPLFRKMMKIIHIKF